jgi:hypothetical protein
MIHEIQAFDVVCLPQKKRDHDHDVCASVLLFLIVPIRRSNYIFYPLMVDKHGTEKRGHFHFQYFKIKTI